MNLTNLLRAELRTADDLEVVVSLVELPPHTVLPMHFHPGEEFAYILEGSTVLVQQGKDDVTFRAGEACLVPLEQVHTTRTEDEPVKLVVFRVHRKGAPERVPVSG